MTAVFAIIKRLLASNKISFIITALVVLCATSSGDVVLSNGNYTWLLAVLTPFFFVFYDFTKPEDLYSMAIKRTVYSLKEITLNFTSKSKLILFKYYKTLESPITYKSLVENNLLKKPPMSIVQVDNNLVKNLIKI